MNLNGIQVYVASLSGNRVNIVDTTTGTSPEWIDVDMDPHGLVVNPYNAELYVAHSISLGPPGGSIIVIDLATHQVKQRVEIAGGAGRMTLSHDCTVLYCIDVTEDHICEFAVE